MEQPTYASIFRSLRDSIKKIQKFNENITPTEKVRQNSSGIDSNISNGTSSFNSKNTCSSRFSLPVIAEEEPKKSQKRKRTSSRETKITDFFESSSNSFSPKKRLKNDENSPENFKKLKFNHPNYTGFVPCQNSSKYRPGILGRNGCFICSSGEVQYKLASDVLSETGEKFKINEKIYCHNPGIFVYECLSGDCSAQAIEWSSRGVGNWSCKERLPIQASFTKEFLGKKNKKSRNNPTEPGSKINQYNDWKKIPSQIRHLIKHYQDKHPGQLLDKQSLNQLFSITFIDTCTVKNDQSQVNQIIRNKIIDWTTKLKPSILSETYMVHSNAFQRNNDLSVKEIEKVNGSNPCNHREEK